MSYGCNDDFNYKYTYNKIMSKYDGGSQPPSKGLYIDYSKPGFNYSKSKQSIYDNNEDVDNELYEENEAGEEFEDEQYNLCNNEEMELGEYENQEAEAEQEVREESQKIEEDQDQDKADAMEYIEDQDLNENAYEDYCKTNEELEEADLEHPNKLEMGEEEIEDQDHQDEAYIQNEQNFEGEVQNNDEEKYQEVDNQEQNENEEYEDNGDNLTLDMKIKKIYEYYCAYGERLNLSGMGSTKYLKFAIEAGLVTDNLRTTVRPYNNDRSSSKLNEINLSQPSKSSLTKTKLDLIFTNFSLKSGKLTLDAYTKSLVQLAKEYSKHQNYSKKETLIVFINEIIIPLYDRIFHSNSKEVITTADATSNDIQDFIFIEEVSQLLEKSAVGLYCIYKTYFKHELMGTSKNLEYIKDSSIKQFSLFIKDFDLCPTIIPKHLTNTLYQGSVNTPIENEESYFRLLSNIEFGKVSSLNARCSNILGYHFTFFKFIRLIIKLSTSAFSNIDETIKICSLKNKNNSIVIDKNSPVELKFFDILVFVLEKIEASVGFNSLEKKSNSTHNSKTSFLINRQVVSAFRKSLVSRIEDAVNESKQNEEQRKSISPIPNIHSVSTEINSPNLNNSELKSEGGKNGSLDILEYVCDTYGAKLQILFEAYCSLGHNKKESKILKSSNFYKFLKISKLIKEPLKNTGFMSTKQSATRLATSSHRITTKILDKKRELANKEINESKTDSEIPSKYDHLNMTNNEVDLIFTSLIKKTDKEKLSKLQTEAKGIDFKGFLNAVVLIAKYFSSFYLQSQSIVDSNARLSSKSSKIHIRDSLYEAEFVELTIYIIEKRIFQNNSEFFVMNQDKEEKIELYEALKQESEEDLNIVKAMMMSLEPIYAYYSNNPDFNKVKYQGLLCFEQLRQFCSDFKVFPDLISKSSLIYYFKKKALEIAEDVKRNYKTSEEFIDLSGFIDILSIIAIELPLQEEPFIKRVMTLVDHLSNSFGQEKIFMKSSLKQVPLSSNFRSKLPQYYNSNLNKTESSVSGFYDILMS